MNDPDVIVVGAGLAGLVATHELVKAGRRVLVARPGEPQQPRRPGVLVARRAVLRRHPRAAPDGHQGLATSSRCRTGWARPASTGRATRTSGRASGPRRTSSFAADREARLPARPRPARRCRSSAGPSAAAARATGHGNSVPRFHLTWGTGPEVVRVFAEPVLERRGARAGRVRLPPPGRRADRRGRRRRRRARHRARAERRRRAASASSREAVGDFELRAPAVVVTSGGIGHNHDLIRAQLAGRPARPGAGAHDLRRPGPRRRPDARHHRGRRRAASSTATGCGTTPRASTTGTRSGPTTRSGSSPARRRCGSTRPASGCRRRTSPASTPSAR